MSSADNAALFDELLRPHLPRLYRLACRLTASKVDADDLFQDVLTRLYPRLNELQTLQHAPSWLGRVMYNQFIDNQRRFARQRLRMVEESSLAGGSIEALGSTGDNLHDAVWREQIQTLDRALSMLSDAHRLVVLLHDAEGYKLHEIQEITGDPLGTVKSRLHRARARLREILAEDGTIC
jgi:RNA polymerase sigma factor (sigma-70 family)